MTDHHSNSTADCKTSRHADDAAHSGRLLGQVRRHVATAVVALTAALLGVAPAFAVIGVGIEEIHEEQVELFLQRSFNTRGGDGVWTWDSMIHACTKTLMRGSPEQDPEQSRVRFTPDAERFLQRCAVVKGFRALAPDEEPSYGPLTTTQSRRIGVVDDILSAWMNDTSGSGFSKARRNRECAEWVGSQPEWKAMVAKGEGMTAAATVVLLACAMNKGFEMRAEKKGAPLKALNDAAEAETEAAKRP